MDKTQINHIVNEYLNFHDDITSKGEIAIDQNEYDEKYKLWLEKMETELNQRRG